MTCNDVRIRMSAVAYGKIDFFERLIRFIIFYFVKIINILPANKMYIQIEIKKF